MPTNLISDEIRSFGTGGVYVADVSATEPADATEALNSEWLHLGYITEEGVTPNFGKARNPVTSWQSFPDPVRNLKATAESTFSFGLMQWNQDTLSLALGGGTWTTDSAGVYTFTPPDASATDEKAIAIEGYDGDTFYRIIVRRCENQAGVQFAWTGTEATALPIVMTMLSAPEGEESYIIQAADDAIISGTGS